MIFLLAVFLFEGFLVRWVGFQIVLCCLGCCCFVGLLFDLLVVVELIVELVVGLIVVVGLAGFGVVGLGLIEGFDLELLVGVGFAVVLEDFGFGSLLGTVGFA
ncbi:hypothetical protein CMI38_01490 [Candidatus Pacearchaeota archaeon]|nr:hypothetical protein [Candidatus Pacearchaeota archaeon]